MILIDTDQRANLKAVKEHPWLCEDYDGPPESFLPVRETPTELDEAIVSKLATYGFENENVRQRILNDPQSPAFSTYFLIKEKNQREEEAKKFGANPPAEPIKKEEKKPLEELKVEEDTKKKPRARTLTGNDTGKWQQAAATVVQNTATKKDKEQSHRKEEKFKPRAEEEEEEEASDKPRSRRFSLDGASSAAVKVKYKHTFNTRLLLM